MSRLTRYDEKQKQYIRLASRLAVDNKLGKLEDLEEEIGCPLEVITQALKQEIWYLGNRERNYLYQMSANALKFISGDWVITNGSHYANTQDYKKTWWLKKDKSE